MKYSTTALLITISLLVGSCRSVENGQYSIKQGVFGKVVWLQGNMMPSPSMQINGNAKPIRRTIKIYEYTNFSQVGGEAPLFINIKTRLIKTVKSDGDGYYQAKLPPGRYSIFTVEEDGNKLFANSFDGAGFISAFEVKSNEVVNFGININYKAYY